MKRTKRRLILRRHFVQRWHERVDRKASIPQIRRCLHGAMLSRPIYRLFRHYFWVEACGCRAICALDSTGTWQFITVLYPYMSMRVG